MNTLPRTTLTEYIMAIFEVRWMVVVVVVVEPLTKPLQLQYSLLITGY